MATIHSTRPTIGIVKRTLRTERDPLPPIDYVPTPIPSPHGGPTDDVLHVSDHDYAGAVLDALRAHTIPLHFEVCGGESPHWLERDDPEPEQSISELGRLL